MIYLDTSALAKLVVAEAETQALTEWLTAQPDERWVTSVIGRIELTRLARRLDLDNEATRLLAGIDTIPMTAAIAESAATVEQTIMRTLDAIHLASVLSLGSAIAVVCCYDRRLAAAVAARGMTVAAPGPTVE